MTEILAKLIKILSTLELDDAQTSLSLRFTINGRSVAVSIWEPKNPR